MKPRRPMLRYHGGKWLLSEWIISHFPIHETYVEPYGGGGNVLLKKERTKAEVYNDLDGEVVNVFRCARDHGPALKELLRLTPFSREEFKLTYKAAKCPIETARRTIARSFMGFGGNAVTAKNGMTGFRGVCRGDGTLVAKDWKSYAECFELLIERMRGVVIENRDALEVMGMHDSPKTLHYVDPPYVFETRGDLRHGYRHEMADFQHEQMAVFLKTLAGSVIVSGYNCPLYQDLFADWQRVDRKAFADGAKKRTESLWLSPNLKQSLRLI